MKLFIVLSCLLFSSCYTGVGSFRYPNSWGDIDTESNTGKCPIIEGMYYEKGEDLDEYYEGGKRKMTEVIDGMSPLGLTHFLFSKNFSDPYFGNYSSISNAYQVEIIQLSDEKLEVKVWAMSEMDEKLLHEKTLSMQLGDYICDQDGLKISYSETLSAPLLLSYGKSNEVRIFNRSIDGYLSVNYRSIGAGVALLVLPILSGDGYWVRWKPVTE